MASRGAIFIAIAAACVVGGAIYVVVAASNSKGTDSHTRVARAGDDSEGLATLAGVRVLAQAVDRRDPRLNGGLFVVAGSRAGRPRRERPSCQRSYLAGDRGICLRLEHSGVDYRALVFDGRFRVLRKLTLTGLPSRARVSPDGRVGSVTTFVSGDSYTSPGQFSTRTKLIDLRRGRWIADLERFAIERDGRRIHAVDFNFWGVTFARDDDRFYATLGTGGHQYLIQGRISTRSARVLRDGVECPSLAPDQTRIAFKHRVKNGSWRLHVLDLRTLRDRPLAERRSIDDQAEWIDNRRIAYGDGRDVWVVAADGGGSPVRLLRNASSPAVLR